MNDDICNAALGILLRHYINRVVFWNLCACTRYLRSQRFLIDDYLNNGKTKEIFLERNDEDNFNPASDEFHFLFVDSSRKMGYFVESKSYVYYLPVLCMKYFYVINDVFLLHHEAFCCRSVMVTGNDMIVPQQPVELHPDFCITPCFFHLGINDCVTKYGVCSKRAFVDMVYGLEIASGWQRIKKLCVLKRKELNYVIKGFIAINMVRYHYEGIYIDIVNIIKHVLLCRNCEQHVEKIIDRAYMYGLKHKSDVNLNYVIEERVYCNHQETFYAEGAKELYCKAAHHFIASGSWVSNDEYIE